MSLATGILLVRHGETDDNAAGRIQGSIDTPLNDRGREQARAVAGEVAGRGLSALYTSQLRRARETAEIIAEAVAIEPVVDARLAESHRGAWEGRLLRDLEREEPLAYAAWWRGGRDFRYPGGESLAEHAARVRAALEAVASGPLPALVVSHGGSIRCALAAPDLVAIQSIPVPNAQLINLPRGVAFESAPGGAGTASRGGAATAS